MQPRDEARSGFLLSILIATMDSRRDQLEWLLTRLRGQIAAHDLEDTVEILVESDDGSVPTGAKRNSLMKRATGTYLVSVDDDDDVHDDYLPLIVGALRKNPGVDVVGIRGRITFREGEARDFVMSTRCPEYRVKRGVYMRPPHHLNPTRRDIALRFPYEEAYTCEDSDRAMRMARARCLESEVFIDEPLYHYRWSRRWKYQRIIDATEFVRHPLGLQLWNRHRVRRWFETRILMHHSAVSVGEASMAEAEDTRGRSGEVHRITPAAGVPPLELARLWDARGLIYILALREIKVRYRQSLAGVGWVLLQPLLTMAVLTIVFSRVAGVSDNTVPYPAFALSALVPWLYFSHSLTKITQSLVENHALITKVYFPRLAFPVAAALAALLDLVINCGLLAVVLLYYRVGSGWALLAAPIFVALAVVASLSVGLWLSALYVRYRDVVNVLPFMLQTLLFLSPVAYAVEFVPAGWRTLYALNPLVSIIGGFRWSLVGGQPPSALHTTVSMALMFLLLIGGLYFFRHSEDRFADVI